MSEEARKRGNHVVGRVGLGGVKPTGVKLGAK